MDGEIMEPQTPELTSKVSLHWISMLVQCLKIAEDSGDLLTRRLGFSGSLRQSQ
jgi:hypothetical protein